MNFTKSPFGDFLTPEDHFPEDATAVIVCRMDYHSLQPIQILLPHQLYREEIRQLIKESAGSEIVIYPIRSHERVEIKLSDV